MKDVYDMGSGDTRAANYAANSDVYGDAIYETSSGTYNSSGDSNAQSWHGDYSYFPYSGYPFFSRGGYCDISSGAGAFYFGSAGGGTGSNIGFRPVLVSP